MKAKRPVWTSASPWLLPLRYDPDEKTPSKRFIQVAQRFASAKSSARVARKDVGILLIRSHLEGFGVPRNLELATGFLEDTAQLGESKCQSMLRLFLGVIGTKTVSLEHSVSAILQGAEEPAATDKSACFKKCALNLIHLYS